MRHNKFLTALIVLSMIALFTTSWKSIPTPKKQWVSITGIYDFSTFPHTTGTFTTSGALNISGYSTMDIGLNANGIRGHCVVVLTPSDGSGTITIHQECTFGPPVPKGQWHIVSGTGAYTNLRGNGSLLMPPQTEAMTGVIY
jgi:hypothetical protein